jgi:hypothetical protein
MAEDDPTTAAPDASPPAGWRRTVVRVVRLTALFFGLLLLGLGAAAVALVYPYVRDDLRIDGIVRMVALDWRDFGRARAEERLRYEFAAQGVGRHARPDDCRLVDEDDIRRVRCTWAVDIRVGSRALPLGFSSDIQVLPTGDLSVP